MKIGILDHMGYGNLGDAATQDVVIESIRKRLPDAELVGFSFIPSDTTARHGIPCYPILRWYPKPDDAREQANAKSAVTSRLKSALKKSRLIYTWVKPILETGREILFWLRSYRRLRELDLLIISGGGQLSELWHGPWSHPFTILKFSLLTKLAGKKVYFLNVGAGPLRHPISRRFAKWAVLLSDYRSFRDEDSRELVRSLGVTEKMHVYPDSAYGLEPQRYTKTATQRSSRQIVGLNPIGFCDPRIWPRKDEAIYRAYVLKLARFARWLSQQGYELRVFTTESSLDRSVIEDLKAQLGSELSSPGLIEAMFPAASETVSDVIQQMSEFDFVITSKFHGIIFSQVLAKPVISLSYHPKMDVAMRNFGQSSYSADIEHFEVEWLVEAFQSCVSQSRSIVSGSVVAVAANAARLCEQFDELFLPEKSALDTGCRQAQESQFLGGEIG
jgi:polysaccharide pyruvyl transferase WcaK-like protein